MTVQCETCSGGGAKRPEGTALDTAAIANANFCSSPAVVSAAWCTEVIVVVGEPLHGNCVLIIKSRFLLVA
jgi:hypothetical protein